MAGVTAPVVPVVPVVRPASVEVAFDGTVVLEALSFEPPHAASTTPAPAAPSRPSARRRWIGWSGISFSSCSSFVTVDGPGEHPRLPHRDAQHGPAHASGPARTRRGGGPFVSPSPG